MYIYIDIIILVNLFINTLILLLTAWIVGTPYNKLRIFIAVLISVIYVVMFVKYPGSLLSNPLLKFMISVLIIVVAFGRKTWQQFLLLLGTFYVISFFLGGAVIGYYFFCQNIISLESLMHSVLNFNLKLVGQGILLGCVLIFFLFKAVLRKKIKLKYVNDILLENNENSIVIKGFLDTGNHLYEMTGGKPVILVEQEVLKPLFSKPVNKFLQEVNDKDWLNNWQDCPDDKWKKSIAIIAYKGIGGSDLLIGQRIDKVKFRKANNWCEFDCVIGIYPKQLSSDGSYQALLHAGMCID